MTETSPITTNALYLAYPVCLGVTYLISSIAIKIQSSLGKVKSRRDSGVRYASSILWLLLLKCTLLIATSSITAYVVILKSKVNWWGTQPYLASQIAILLFYIASILPDPDLPYRPSESNLYTWLVSIIFETTFAILGTLTASHAKENDVLNYAVLAICYLRIGTLSAISVLFFARPRNWINPAFPGLVDVEQSASYGTWEPSMKAKTGAGDAQSTGWLDYLVGFGKLFPYVWPVKSNKLQIRAFFCFLLLTAQRVINILVPLQLGKVVGSLGSGTIPIKQILIYTVFRALQGQQGVIASIRALLWIPIGQTTYRQLTESAFGHVLSLSLEFHLGKRLGEVMSALSKGSSINTFLDSLIFQLFPMVADIGIAAAYLLVTLDPFYSLIIIAMGWTYLFVTIYMAKYRGRARRDMVNKDREMDAVKTDAIIAYEIVHYNDAVGAERSRFTSRITGFQASEYAVLVSLNLLNATQNLIFTFGVFLVSLLSAYHVSIDIEKVEMFVILLAYLTQLQAPLSFFGSFYTQIQNNLIDAERMLKLFNEKPTVVDQPGAIEMLSCEGSVAFRNVNFSYDPRKAALQDITFEVKPGSSVAIVGESGSGKSTLLRLLFRFYNVDSGKISIDGHDVKDFTIQSLRSHFGVVPQETMLFNDSLMYNLLYSKPDATEQEVYEACTAASVHEKILAFPDAYDTKVGERGLRLSGGEKQRVSDVLEAFRGTTKRFEIAIARAILKSPRIILMDEATASLDSETEKFIQNSLAKVSEGRTTITIAHRLSTIVNADEIIVLHQGRIVEQGSHSSLLSLNGRYSQMWNKQTKDSFLFEQLD